MVAAKCRTLPWGAVVEFRAFPGLGDRGPDQGKRAMGNSSSGTEPSFRPIEDRLDSWKEIAVYLDRDVTTVQRWEKREGMPVHRHVHDRMGSVYAWRAELDAWARSRAAQDEVAKTSEQSAVLPPFVTRLYRNWWIAGFFLTLLVTGIGLDVWLERTEYFWRSPIANAQFQTITDLGGLEQAAAVSQDGKFVAFLSDRDGPIDLWITQVGSGEFHNLTRGSAPEVANPLLRTVSFSPDGSLVAFWTRRQSRSGEANIGVWAVPTLGGQPRPYLEGAAEFDWSRDGSRLAYHTPGPGDPLFVTDGTVQPQQRPIFTAPAGLHSHFQIWAPDSAFIYFVQGTLPDKLDIWRIRPEGGSPERITSQNRSITYPVFLDRRTLAYIAADPDGSGASLYSIDVEHRIPHRLTSALERPTSLAASVDGRRLVLTLSTPKRTLWRLGLDNSLKVAPAAPISLTASTGFSPRLASNYLLYAAVTGDHESIWKVANGVSTELWNGHGAQIIGGPTIHPDGRLIAFSVCRESQTLLYVMQADGTSARVVSSSLDLQGDPVWAPDGQSITTAANDHGVPHLFRVPLDGGQPAAFVQEYSIDPAWSPDGRFLVYSGPDIGTTFSVKAVTASGEPYPLPPLTLTRGARHLAFLPGGEALVVLRGEIQHKNLWLVNLTSGTERQLTNFAPDFDIRDFGLSPSGDEIVLERVQERSEVVMLDLPRR